MLRTLVMHGFLMLVCLLMCCLSGLPLASVSETFEYDVLRWLNNVAVLHHAQKYIGNQILPHLQALEWGFRFGGSVINSRAMSNIIIGMVATLAGTLGQAVFDSSSKV